MNKSPSVYVLTDLLHYCQHGGVQKEVPDFGYVPARPEGLGGLWNRISAAWLVFTGQADAVVWNGQ